MGLTERWPTRRRGNDDRQHIKRRERKTGGDGMTRATIADDGSDTARVWAACADLHGKRKSPCISAGAFGLAAKRQVGNSVGLTPNPVAVPF